ncbi:Histone-lysine N-methyltransferase, H3 lysine-9 specific dim-5 [Neonectria ditissima]|uniref:Histone-lysine N-methyltransferase, H3 lysine-9 specific dim-5 n=1 Tax=Neonectria ditissima TaxID=78410 RepID=A0A0P7BM17_9HYPO|nr:Histone-lysine N-methyltransferase, H3 lysine-9 specific dim-5 [Neonectria ditissima]
MEQATEQHFYHHGKEGREDEKSSCHWCQIRSFPTHKTSPITVVNEVDTEVLKDFRFIDSNVLGHGVEPAEDSFRSGCACTHDSDCQFTGCLCLADIEDDENDSDDDNGMDLDGPRPSRKAYAYHTHGSKAGLLRSRLHDSKVPIYECHQGCACTIDCPNRVVERGRTIPLQIFRTTDRGWGVKSPDYIKKGQFVDRYFGEIITSEEADRRRSASTISQKKDVYLFALDKFTDPDSLDPRLKGPPLEVDGEFMSGPTRFINHSCDPNMRIFARVGDHADKHIHDLALFAIKDIPKGDELTFDYVGGVAYDGEEPEGDDVGHMTPLERPASDGTSVGLLTQEVITEESPGNVSTQKQSIPFNLEAYLFAGLKTWSRNQTEPRPKPLTMQAHRTLRRRSLTNRQILRDQISRGRPDPSQTWCGDRSCPIDNLIFEIPSKCAIDKKKSKSGCLVKTFYEDFAVDMADALFPKLFTTSAKIRKRQNIMSFVDSPPIRAALGRFLRSCKSRQFQPPNEEMEAELVNARPIFHDLMFGEKTADRVKSVHLYIKPKKKKSQTRWALGDFVLQFLVTAEIWRSHKTCRSAAWSLGSSEVVAEFMTAMLMNFWHMQSEGCLEFREFNEDHQWEVFWDDWLGEYPVTGDQDEDSSGEAFVTREEAEANGGTMLEVVGYIGALGSCDASYKPSRPK